MLRIIELFAGIGAWSKALENLNIDLEIVDAIEINPYSIKSYNAIHNTNFQTQDICKWSKDFTDIDIICHSSPCQDFSSAGNNLGGDENSGTRSSLMYESLRIVGKIKPKYVLWENVKNLLSKKHKHNFEKYLIKLQELGYNSYYKVLNAKDYEIPQERERIFVISIRKDIDTNTFRFPKKQPLTTKLIDILEANTYSGNYLTDERIKLLLNNSNDNISIKKSNKLFGNNTVELYYKGQVVNLPVIAGDRGRGLLVPNKESNYKKRKRMLEINTSGLSFTLSTFTNDNLVIENGSDKLRSIYDFKIRPLTPLECWRLMGFNDEDYYKAAHTGNCKSELHKQAGNSIVVNVLEAIFKELLRGER